MKPCFACKNVVSLEHGTRLSDTGYLVDVSCSRPERFDPIGADGLWRAHDQLAAHVAGSAKSAFEELEKAYGVRYEPHGILADVPLRTVASQLSYTRDPMHITLAGGVLNVELYLILRSVGKHYGRGSGFGIMRAFCDANWSFPKSASTKRLADIFSEVRESSTSSAETFKGSFRGADGLPVGAVFP